MNLSCLLYGPGDARYEEHPLPALTDPFDLLVRIHYVGVCGSDVSYLNLIAPKPCMSEAHQHRCTSGVTEALGSTYRRRSRLLWAMKLQGSLIKLETRCQL